MLEGCIDAAQHVCASEGYGPPDTNADAMRTLAKHGLVDREEGETMAKAVGFRNLLVHGYAEIDDLRVLSCLAEIDDLAAFVGALARLL